MCQGQQLLQRLNLSLQLIFFSEMFTQWDAWRYDQELVKGCKIYFPQCSPSVPLNKEGFFAVIIYMASTYSSVKLSHLKDHPLFNKLPLQWQTRVLRIHSNLGFGRLKRQENIQHFTYSQKSTSTLGCIHFLSNIN